MIAIGGRKDLDPRVVSSMYEFRHETFVRRLHWSLPLFEGLEQDQYDSDAAVYFVVHDVHENVTACARLLPTTAPYMLPDLFAELLGGRLPPRDTATWELSRFATSVRRSRAGRVLSLSQPTLNLLDVILRFARDNAVERLVLVTSIALERLLLRTALDVHRLAAPARMPDGLIVALLIEVPRWSFANPADAVATRDAARRIEAVYARECFGKFS
ncbi:MAG: acyl-homoserine-lactone synthase [Steroidobacteraceae bacterium]